MNLFASHVPTNTAKEFVADLRAQFWRSVRDTAQQAIFMCAKVQDAGPVRLWTYASDRMQEALRDGNWFAREEEVFRDWEAHPEHREQFWSRQRP